MANAVCLHFDTSNIHSRWVRAPAPRSNSTASDNAPFHGPSPCMLPVKLEAMLDWIGIDSNLVLDRLGFVS